MNTSPMLHINNLHAGYGATEVLHGIDLDVCKGEWVGILGPNGSGKTTLLKTMGGLLRPKTGHVQAIGKNIASLSHRQRARLLASVPQKADSSLAMSCLSVVLMGRFPHVGFLGGYSETDMEAALKAMQETRTLELSGRLVTETSGGEFRRVLIARALAQETDILLLDEATSNLDIRAKVEIYDLLKMNQQNGQTIVSVIHDLNLAALYCDRLVFLKKGRAVCDGTVEEVFNEHTLSDIYETQVDVAEHPRTGKPQAFFVPGDSLHTALGR